MKKIKFIFTFAFLISLISCASPNRINSAENKSDSEYALLTQVKIDRSYFDSFTDWYFGQWKYYYVVDGQASNELSEVFKNTRKIAPGEKVISIYEQGFENSYARKAVDQRANLNSLSE